MNIQAVQVSATFAEFDNFHEVLTGVQWCLISCQQNYSFGLKYILWWKKNVYLREESIAVLINLSYQLALERRGKF